MPRLHPEMLVANTRTKFPRVAMERTQADNSFDAHRLEFAKTFLRRLRPAIKCIADLVKVRQPRPTDRHRPLLRVASESDLSDQEECKQCQFHFTPRRRFKSSLRLPVQTS